MQRAVEIEAVMQVQLEHRAAAQHPASRAAHGGDPVQIPSLVNDQPSLGAAPVGIAAEAVEQRIGPAVRAGLQFKHAAKATIAARIGRAEQVATPVHHQPVGAGGVYTAEAVENGFLPLSTRGGRELIHDAALIAPAAPSCTVQISRSIHNQRRRQATVARAKGIDRLIAPLAAG